MAARLKRNTPLKSNVNVCFLRFVSRFFFVSAAPGFSMRLFIVGTTCAIKFEHHFNCYIVHYLFYYYFSCLRYDFFSCSSSLRVGSSFREMSAFRSLCHANETKDREKDVDYKPHTAKKTCVTLTDFMQLTSELRGAKRVRCKRRRW